MSRYAHGQVLPVIRVRRERGRCPLLCVDKSSKRALQIKGAASRLIAKAIEGSEAECRLIRVARRLALKRVMPRIEKVALPSLGSMNRHYFTIPFGQRGMPMVKTSTSRREPAMCNLLVATYANPNQAMRDKLGTQSPDPTLTRSKRR